MLGHAATLASPSISELNQAIGQGTLGMNDAQIDSFAKLYWYTIEVGLCKEDGANKAYGAAILTSVEETERCMGKDALVKDFDLQEITGIKDEIVPDKVQNTYYVAESFPKIIKELHDYAAEMRRKR
jgi:phenylalanine-4-hydroxylase